MLRAAESAALPSLLAPKWRWQLPKNCSFTTDEAAGGGAGAGGKTTKGKAATQSDAVMNEPQRGAGWGPGLICRVLTGRTRAETTPVGGAQNPGHDPDHDEA